MVGATAGLAEGEIGTVRARRQGAAVAHQLLVGRPAVWAVPAA
jgi:hypothetical protein